MMAPQAYEHLVHWRHEQLLAEAAADRHAASAQLPTPGLRPWLARSLYSLATWLSANVAEARSAPGGIRSVATCAGVEYWRPSVMPLRR
jgi:hypothetical protein